MFHLPYDSCAATSSCERGAKLLARVTAVASLIAQVACQDAVNAPTFTPQMAIAGVTPRIGPLAGGTSLTITGINFDNVTSVNVDGIELLNWTARSTTEITGTTPAARSVGTKDVVVASRSNGVTRCMGCFTYAIMAPTITDVSPVSGPASGGTRLTITGSNFIDVTQVFVGTGVLLDLAVMSATQITGRVPPANSSGVADVVAVSRHNHEGRCEGCFRYEQAGGDTAAIVLTPNRFAINPGEQARAILRLPRLSGSEGRVTPRVIAAPPGVTIAFQDRTGIYGQFLVSIYARTTVPPGDYRIEIGALVSGMPELSSPLALTVLPTTTDGNTTVRTCGRYPFLVAYQDGDGPWTRATGAGDYRFNITAGRGALALVEGHLVGGINVYAFYNTRVFHGTQAELSELFANCQAPSPIAAMQLTVANAAGPLRIALGNYQTSASTITTAQLPVHVVPSDLVISYQSGWEGAGAGFTGKAIIRRNLNPTPGSTAYLPVLDFNAPEAVQLVSRRLLNRDALHSVWVELLTSNGTNALLHCEDPYNYGWCNPTSSYLAIPAPQPGDVHRLNAIAHNSWQMSCFVQPLDQSMSPFPLGPVSISTAATVPSVRFRTRYTRQAEYNGGVQVTYTSAQPTRINADRSVDLNVSAAYLGRAAIVDLTIPDFSTIAGWDNDWGLKGTSSARFEARGWIESGTGGASCGGIAEPFGRLQRPQASEQYAAWSLQTVTPIGVSDSARRQ